MCEMKDARTWNCQRDETQVWGVEVLYLLGDELLLWMRVAACGVGVATSVEGRETG